MNAKKELEEIIHFMVDVQQIRWDANIYEYMDSMDTIATIMKIEEVFNITVNDCDAENVMTANDALKMIYKYRPELKRSEKIKKILNG